MDKENIEIYEGVEVPVSPVLAPIRNKGYGRIADLPDEELASPAELERMVFIQEFGPILALPRPRSKSVIKPTVDEDGRLDWGAFGTVDFDRYAGGFNKSRYKLDILKEQLFNERLMIEMISSRIKPIAKYEIIKLVFDGILDVDDISDMEMYCLAKRCLSARRLQREIQTLAGKGRVSPAAAEMKILLGPLF